MELGARNADDWEAAYAEFYQACERGNNTASLADVLAMADHESPVAQSYALLFMGALVDGGRLAAKDYDLIEGHVLALLGALSDYRVKDGEGRFIHFLSHAAFLVDSLKNQRTGGLPEALFDAYLRAEQPFSMNEDTTVGGYLLTTLNAKVFEAVLAKLAPQDGEGQEANKKALWLAMFALNAQLNLQPLEVFAPLLATFAAQITD